MHVAVDANSLAWGWGGIPKYVDRIVRELAHSPGVRVTLLANTRRPIAAIPGTREVVCRRRGGTLWRNGFVAPWLARERPDVFWAAETLVPWRLPVPAVVTVHDVATLRLPGVKPRAQRLAYRTSTRRGVRAASRVIAVSQATAADAERLLGADPDRIRVVPLGIDAGYTPGDREAARRALAARFGLRAPFVLGVGAIEPRKGLDTLVGAAHVARARRLPWRVVLAGSPGYRAAELLRDAEAAGVVAVGRVAEEELVDLYRAADVLAAPALYEGFGLPPLEAMACGTPAVVAAGSGGLVEVSGPAAVVVADRRPEAWVDAIEHARGQHAHLARAGLRHSAGYRWPAVAEETLRVLREAAGRQ
jgi:glycosyltransferase involved in cell wall biosynthesis